MSTPDPLHIISLGAGVQSSTMALMAAHGEITPMPDCAIFADTQAEPASVYRWLGWLEKQLPFPVHRVTAGDLAAESLRVRRSRNGHDYVKRYVPSYSDGRPMPRKCTMDFKLAPIDKAMRSLAAVKRGEKSHRVTCWIGISLDEATRMKPPRHPWQRNRWPLVDMRIRRADCLRWMEAHNYPHPPRSACTFCPYHNDVEWREMRDHDQDSWRAAVEFERAMPGEFLHRSMVPLDQVDLSTAAEKGQINMFENECEGMCGV